MNKLTTISNFKLFCLNKTMSLMKSSVRINGEIYKYVSSFTVLSLLQYLGFNTKLIVVDYNGTILQKEFWSQTYLENNDKIELLTIAGGG